MSCTTHILHRWSINMNMCSIITSNNMVMHRQISEIATWLNAHEFFGKVNKYHKKY